jgi:hypothetical protein
MNMKYFVFGVLGALFGAVIVMAVWAITEEEERRETIEAHLEDIQTRMQDVLVVGKDGQTYKVTASYRLVSVAREGDPVRKQCEKEIRSLIKETASRTKIDDNGSTQIHQAVTRSLNVMADITKYDHDCSVRAPIVGVFQQVL